MTGFTVETRICCRFFLNFAKVMLSVISWYPVKFSDNAKLLVE